MRRTRIFFILAVIISLAAGGAGGYFYFSYRNAQTVDAIIKQVINKDEGKSAAVDFSLFWQVWDRLHARYVDTDSLDTQQLVYGAISGMVAAAGDPYTVFFEPVTARKFQEEVSGAFSGVGMELGMRDGAITVIAPIKDSPAIRAGIRAGDVIVKIDDASAEGMSVEEAVNLIRGKKGTTVRLSVAREGEDALLEFSLVRDTIKIPAVDWKLLNGTVAYLQIYSFNGNVDDEFAEAIREIEESSADRLILDLRNNPGGLLDSAVNLAGWFLEPKSVVVKEKFSSGLIDEMRTSGNARLVKMPVVILMNGGSASASEILAGALHDNRNIQIIGEQSFGKGSVQQIESFYNGSTLKVTVAKWLTPNGVSISETGIAPTTEIIITPKEYDEKGWLLGEPGKDPQLDAAITAVKAI